MKSLRNDKYFIMDIMNMTLGILAILLGGIAFIDLRANAFLLPYILFIGGIINILHGSKRMMNQKMSAFLLLVSGIIFIVSACISWMGFGGFL